VRAGKGDHMLLERALDRQRAVVAVGEQIRQMTAER
jgi:hypothetical protein